jgi:hypothetical protein
MEFCYNSFEDAKEILQNDGEHRPLFILLDKKGTPNLIPAPFSDDREKNMAIAAVRQIAKKIEAPHVMFICESWMVVRKEGEEHIDGKVSEQPDKVELLMAVSQSLHALQDTWQLAKIIRNSKGKITEVREEKGFNPDKTAGRFADMLARGER